MESRLPAVLALLTLSCAPLSAQIVIREDQQPVEPSARRFDRGGDLDKIVWNRPFRLACAKAAKAGRVMLVKPIMGGGNTPRPSGVPCGGVDDCEGSW